ncbi:hypothetical protein [Blastomonas sp. CCH2-A2]|nr:hypothetical protein [Blastomonas sp. CCH2-A2]
MTADNTISCDEATDRNLWHLVCQTRLGRVSILKNLDTETARLTYQRLRPDEHPEEYIYPQSFYETGSWSGCSFGRSRSYSANDDWLEKVHVIGPPGAKLDPWAGVAPRIVDLRTPEERAAEAEIKKFESGERLDVWNYPRRWEGVADPHTQTMRLPDDFA